MSVDWVIQLSRKLTRATGSRSAVLIFPRVHRQIVLTASSKSGCAVKICTGSPTGKAVGYAEIPAGGKLSEVSAAVQGLTGNQDLYFVFSGQAEMDCWIAK
ncbi:MAG: carbohydrate-binding protein [Ruminococcus callidus]